MARRLSMRQEKVKCVVYSGWIKRKVMKDVIKKLRNRKVRGKVAHIRFGIKTELGWYWEATICKFN